METQNKPQQVAFEAIRRALKSGDLKPGMRLPSERKMAETYGISRTHIREALRTLETYGIIRTLPQSGSVLVGTSVSALDGMLGEMLQFNNRDYASLAEVRCMLEDTAVRLCAQRRSEHDLTVMESMLREYDQACQDGDREKRILADNSFHRCIVAGAQNPVLAQLLALVNPEIMKAYNEQKICYHAGHNPQKEHWEILEAIQQQDADQALHAMHSHLNGVSLFGDTLRKNNASE